MKNKKSALMKMSSLFAVFTVATQAAWAAGNPRLVSFTSTSQGANSAELSCLLSQGCTGFWTPGTADHGLNEGIYLQFENTENLTKIEVVSNAPLVISVNGNRMSTISPKKNNDRSTWVVSWDAAIAIKSVYIGVNETDNVSTPLKIYSISFIGKNGAADRLNVESPAVAKATIQASSILEPVTAYQPANLFDSRYDFAWSTNGKKTKGIGEWFKVTFAKPQDIESVLFWNGYQRSESHFHANGRIQAMTITDNQGHSQEVTLKDQMAMQQIKLGTPLKAATSVEFKIAKIYSGSKYPDVLMSELRFVDPSGRLVLPTVPLQVPTASENIKKWLDKSLSSKICGVNGDSVYISNLDFKLRSDGSFVVYKKSEEGEADVSKDQMVWEGNWQEMDSKLRIFGKRYSTRTDYQQMAYGLAEKRSPAEIFQTDVKIQPYKSMSGAEKEKILARLMKIHQIEKASSLIVREMSKDYSTTQDVTVATSKKVLGGILEKANATIIDSPLFADAFVPSDAGFCQRQW